MENRKPKYDSQDVFSRVFRAGRRTYFFDVKETRAGDYYLTITESKKHYDNDDRAYYRKHKIYLYKEDFKEFEDALKETTRFIIDNKGKDVISGPNQTESDAPDRSPSGKQSKGSESKSTPSLDQLDDENFQFDEE
ncbi:MAG: DUF3276 family protein [Flavobacteriaceae bacterium]|nr:DUF3276 family protein [Flavobacteriaceae bacterium]